MNNFSVILDFETKPTGDAYNAYETTCTLKTTTADGTEFKTPLNQLGRTEFESIETLQRKEVFWTLLKRMSILGIPTEVQELDLDAPPPATDYDIERDKFYKELRYNMEVGKYGEIRKFLSDNGIDLKVRNGEDKKKLADKIVNAVKAREEENAKNN